MGGGWGPWCKKLATRSVTTYMHTATKSVRGGNRHSKSGSSPSTSVPASPIGALPDATSFAFVPFNKAFECITLDRERPVGSVGRMIKSQSAPALEGLTDTAACLAGTRNSKKSKILLLPMWLSGFHGKPHVIGSVPSPRLCRAGRHRRQPFSMLSTSHVDVELWTFLCFCLVLAEAQFSFLYWLTLKPKKSPES